MKNRKLKNQYSLVANKAYVIAISKNTPFKEAWEKLQI